MSKAGSKKPVPSPANPGELYRNQKTGRKVAQSTEQRKLQEARRAAGLKKAT